jgi:tetratricopeptide (TPR) repeat protein
MHRLKGILILSIILTLLLASNVSANQRGIKVTAKTPEGKAIPLYSGSYALIIGNGNYTKGWDPLPGAIRDVKDVARALQENGFQVMLKTNLTRNSFNRAFGDFFYEYGRDKNNRLLVYYAGHGHTQKMATGEDLGYLVMVDAPTPEKNPMGFRLSSVDMQAIVTEAKLTKAKHVLFMFDSCFSGSILNLRERVVPEAISESMSLPVRQFITAGRGNEPVPDHSIFKQSFLDLLEGRDKEPIPDGYITGEELGLYLKNKVPEYNSTQHPQYGKIRDVRLDKGDFVFVLKTRPKLPKGDLSSSKPNDVLDAAALTDQAENELGNYEKAVNILSKAIEIDPDYARAYFVRGGIYFNKRHYVKAVKDLKNLIKLDPDNELCEMAYSLVGNSYQQLDQHSMAIQYFRKGIDLHPETLFNYRYIGDSYLALGENNKAIRNYDKDIELDPKNGHTYRSRGKAYLKLKQYSDAINDFTKAIELNQKDSVSYFNRFQAVSLLNDSFDIYTNNDFLDALKCDKNILNDMINSDPNNSFLYYSRGYTYAILKQYENAIKDMNKSIELDPDYVHSYHTRATCFFEKGQYAEAMKGYNKSMELKPNHAVFYYSRGGVYLKLKQYDQAIRDYNRAIELNPNFAMAYHNRGICYLIEHKTQLACSDLKKACEMNFCDGLNVAMKEGKCL